MPLFLGFHHVRLSTAVQGSPAPGVLLMASCSPFGRSAS
jgi:hypothetical protein